LLDVSQIKTICREQYMESKSIIEVEESVQGALEALPSILRSRPLTSLTQQLVDAVKILVPAGYRPVVELQENGRRKRRTASADNWSPETGEILISFSKDDSTQPQARHFEESPAPVQRVNRVPSGTGRAFSVSRENVPDRSRSSSGSPVSSANSVNSQERELCRALEEVERQGRAFIALRWFRDDVLPATGFSWVSDPDQRQSVLTSAIAKGLIGTSRIPNPRSAFPTTAIRLNRAPVAPQGEGQQRYSPVRIHGEPLSSTILRDRGTY
jgi:hypothetical protein